EGDEQTALAAEVVVEQAGGDTGLARHLTGRHLGIASLGKQSARSLQDFLAPGGGWQTGPGTGGHRRQPTAVQTGPSALVEGLSMASVHSYAPLRAAADALI